MSSLVVPLYFHTYASITVGDGEDGTVVMEVGPESGGVEVVERVLSPDDALALSAALTHYAREAQR